MEIGPIFFKEILFDFLEELAQVVTHRMVMFWEGKIEEQDFSFPK